MSENKTGKYLKYAFGEIILVVIGILIALQINNWNEFNKDRETGLGYLKRIKTDLVKDTLYLNERIQLAADEKSSFKLFIKLMHEKQATRKEFSQLISSVLWDLSNLIIEDKSYVEITNSGKLNYIHNETIRNQIMDYYRKCAIDNFHISEMNDTGNDMFTRDIYMRILPYYTSVIDSLYDGDNLYNKQDWKFINNPNSKEFKDLQTVAIYYWWKQNVSLNYYKDLVTSAKELIQIIDNEINQVN